MRYLILSSLLLASTFITYAQKPFEGLIRYHAKPAEDIVQTGDVSGPDSILAYFAPDRIRTEAYQHGQLIQTTLVALDLGKIMDLKPDTKTFTSKSLARPEAAPSGPPEIIAGYSTRPLAGKIYNAMASGMRYTAWVSDSLLFPIPENYEEQMELIFIQQGHIALKLLVIFQLQSTSFGADGPQVQTLTNAVNITATQVVPGTVPQELLSVPADYTLVAENVPVRKFKLDEVKIQESVPEIPPPPPPPPARRKDQ